jgi:hypothetical protein
MSARPTALQASYLSTDAYKKHVAQVLPTAEDEQLLSEIIKSKDWVTQMQMNS